MRPILTALLVASFVAPAAAQQPAIVAASQSDAGADHFQAVLKQALAALARAGSYSLDVESRWNSTDQVAQRAVGEIARPAGLLIPDHGLPP